MAESVKMHPVLDKHSIIAWDMDNTLINGPNSDYFRDYILRHPEKSHHIITFRNKTWADMIWGELGRIGFDARTHISAIHNCPEDIHDSFMVTGSGNIAILNFMHSRRMEMQDFERNITAFPLWKGFKCKQIGASIIIDDMPDFVIPGCSKYDIEFVNALDQLPINFS